MADWTFQSSNTPVQLILESWDHYLVLEPTSTYSFLYFIAVTGMGLFESVIATGQSVRPGPGRGWTTFRRPVPPFPELARQVRAKD